MKPGRSPEFWLIAGPNGAGKTTLVQAAPISLLLPHVRFINPDDIALEILRGDGWKGFADASTHLTACTQAFLGATEAQASVVFEFARSKEVAQTASMKYTGTVKGGVVVLEKPSPLKDGTGVSIEPVGGGEAVPTREEAQKVRRDGKGPACGHGPESRSLFAWSKQEMKQVFADTFFFFAFLNARDAAHEAACEYFENFDGELSRRSGPATIISSRPGSRCC